MTPSHYQLAVFDQVAAAVKAKQQRRPFRHVVVQASAGSGKTTLCVELCSRIAPARCTVVAFGTRNADELKKKLPSNAEASTLHSLGNRAWTQTLGGRQYAPEIAVGGHSRPGKLDRIIGAEVEAGRIPRWLRYKVAKLVDLARMHGIVPGSRRTQQEAQGATFEDGIELRHGSHATAPPTQSYCFTPGDTKVNDVLPLRGLRDDTDTEWELLMRHFDVYVSGWSPQQLIRIARDVLRKSIRFGHRIVDYGDMLYLPTLAEGSSWRLDADVVMVDELQDLDHLQRQMILHVVASGCVFVGVGDCMQAIFGWRGADVDSMDKITAATKAVQLPLSICYRCPTSHIALAQTLVPTIEARPGADEGVLERYDEDGALACCSVGDHGLDCFCAEEGQDGLPLKLGSLRPTHFQPGDLVICRSKAPLVKAAYYLLKNHIPARILGKDIGRGLVAFVDAMKSSSIVDLLKRVEEWTSKALARACELDDEAAMEEAADKRDVLVAVADGVWAQDNDCDSVDVFKARLESLFGEGEDKDKVVTLSTIHRAKGAEANRVWWLDYHKPDLGANFKHDWQRKESANIRFVASTRSRRELRLIRSESLR